MTPNQDVGSLAWLDGARRAVDDEGFSVRVQGSARLCGPLVRVKGVEDGAGQGVIVRGLREGVAEGS